jgi:hypothetical protein
MKKSFLIAIATVAMGPVVHPPVSRAADTKIQCASTGVADGGYSIEVAANLKTAVLSEETIAGPRKVSDLDCQLLPVKRFPDAINNYLVCTDARAPQKGLMVRFYNGGIAGLNYASVRQITDMDGMKTEHEVEFGHLNCQR